MGEGEGEHLAGGSGVDGCEFLSFRWRNVEEGSNFFDGGDELSPASSGARGRRKEAPLAPAYWPACGLPTVSDRRRLLSFLA